MKTEFEIIHEGWKTLGPEVKGSEVVDWAKRTYPRKDFSKSFPRFVEEYKGEALLAARRSNNEWITKLEVTKLALACLLISFLSGPIVATRMYISDAKAHVIAQGMTKAELEEAINSGRSWIIYGNLAHMPYLLWGALAGLGTGAVLSFSVMYCQSRS